jgi:hypothetical protein
MDGVWGILGWECNCLCKNALIIKKTKFEVQMGLVAKSYMRKDFLIYGEMRKYLTIYEEAVSLIPYMTLKLIPSEFSDK